MVRISPLSSAVGIAILLFAVSTAAYGGALPQNQTQDIQHLKANDAERGHLACTSIELSAAAPDSKNCDEICATQASICVAVNSIYYGPAFGCDSKTDRASCRCCKVVTE